MKRTFNKIVIIMTFAITIFSFNFVKANASTLTLIDKDNTNITIVEGFKDFLNENDNLEIDPIAITCCGANSFRWVDTRQPIHMYDRTTRKCISVAYFGNKVCNGCGAIWEKDICYKQTTTGCGKYH